MSRQTVDFGLGVPHFPQPIGDGSFEICNCKLIEAGKILGLILRLVMGYKSDSIILASELLTLRFIIQSLALRLLDLKAMR